MQELLDRMSLILIAVGISISISTYINVPMTLKLAGKSQQFEKQLESLEVQANLLSSDMAKLKLLINEASGSKLDVTDAISTLNKNVSDLSTQYQEAMGILNGDNETMATVREVNVKYDLILKQLDSFKGDIERAEDKVFQTNSSVIGYLWGIIFFLAGIIFQYFVFTKK